MPCHNEQYRAVVLLVEDDPGDQELTRRAFEDNHIRADLHIVNDGEEALRYLHRSDEYSHCGTAPTPDLILLDLNLPRLDGRELLQRIRGDDALKHLTVVVLTTSNLESDILRSYQLNCDSYITKPVQVSDFVQAIRLLQSHRLGQVERPGIPQKPASAVLNGADSGDDS